MPEWSTNCADRASRLASRVAEGDLAKLQGRDLSSPVDVGGRLWTVRRGATRRHRGAVTRGCPGTRYAHVGDGAAPMIRLPDAACDGPRRLTFVGGVRE